MSDSGENPFSRPTQADPENGRKGVTGSSLDQRSALGEIKGRVHKSLIERLNLANLESIERDQAVTAIRQVIQDLLAQEAFALNYDEREKLAQQVLDEIFGRPWDAESTTRRPWWTPG